MNEIYGSAAYNLVITLNDVVDDKDGEYYILFEVEFVHYSDGEISEYDGRNTILAVMMGGVSESSLDAVMTMLADEVIHLITDASEAEYYAANKDVLADQLKERIASAYYHEVTQGSMK